MPRGSTNKELKAKPTGRMPRPRRAQARDSGEAPFWQAVRTRNRAADGTFVYAVTTTRIFCRPSCPAKRPHRENVVFFKTPAGAEAAGYRPCKRCNPHDLSGADAAWRERIETACRAIESAETAPTLRALAKDAGMSPHHFHRRFKAVLGVTPKAYASAVRAARVRKMLPAAATVTQAAFEAGFNSTGRFYETAKSALGMAPARYKAGGEGTTLAVATSRCALGVVLVAATGAGIAAIFLGDDAETLEGELRARFPKAQLIAAGKTSAKLLSRVVAMIDRAAPSDLPLDIRGTAFEQKVWRALRDIPLGTTATYTEIAARIGAPASVRAVARACAANKIAVAIPCHRVVRADGNLAGYRWGMDRKRRLIEQESAVKARSRGPQSGGKG